MTETTIKPIRRVSAYRTSDGTVHETRASAEAHEAGIVLRKALWDLLNRELFHDEDTCDAAVEKLVGNSFRLAPLFEKRARLFRKLADEKRAQNGEAG